MRAALASNKNIPIAILEKLAKAKEQQVRTAVSMNPNTPKEILDKLKG